MDREAIEAELLSINIPGPVLPVGEPDRIPLRHEVPDQYRKPDRLLNRLIRRLWPTNR